MRLVPLLRTPSRKVPK